MIAAALQPNQPPVDLPLVEQARCPVAQLRQHRQLIAPGEAVFGKTMQTQGEYIAFAALVHLKTKAVGIDKSGLDSRVTQGVGNYLCHLELTSVAAFLADC